MATNIAFRKAEIEDIAHMKEILFCALKAYEIPIPDNYSVSDIDSINPEPDSSHNFVLQRDVSIIGFIVLKPITKDCIELKRLYLTSSERGQGLGAYLLHQAIHFARTNQYKSMRLETTSRFREAVSLYRKFGFIELAGVEKASGHDLAFEKRLEVL